MKRLVTSLIALALGVLFTGNALAQSYQRELDERNARVRSNLLPNPGDPAPQRQRAPQQPIVFTHCDPGFCYDNMGRVYHKDGPNVLVGPNGRICNRNGNMWVCN